MKTKTVKMRDHGDATYAFVRVVYSIQTHINRACIYANCAHVCIAYYIDRQRHFARVVHLTHLRTDSALIAFCSKIIKLNI